MCFLCENFYQTKFALWARCRIECMTNAIFTFLYFKNVTTIHITIAPPTFIEHFVARVHNLKIVITCIYIHIFISSAIEDA